MLHTPVDHHIGIQDFLPLAEFVLLLCAITVWHDDRMDNFEHFVKGLGPHAKHYTPAQLKQLHLEVRKLSDILLQRYKATMVLKRRQRFPQASLDASNSDRTIESVLTERVDDSESSQAHDS